MCSIVPSPRYAKESKDLIPIASRDTSKYSNLLIRGKEKELQKFLERGEMQVQREDGVVTFRCFSEGVSNKHFLIQAINGQFFTGASLILAKYPTLAEIPYQKSSSLPEYPIYALCCELSASTLKSDDSAKALFSNLLRYNEAAFNKGQSRNRKTPFHLIANSQKLAELFCPLVRNYCIERRKSILYDLITQTVKCLPQELCPLITDFESDSRYPFTGIDVKDDHNQTALEIAVAAKNHVAINLFTELGAAQPA